MKRLVVAGCGATGLALVQNLRALGENPILYDLPINNHRLQEISRQGGFFCQDGGERVKIDHVQVEPDPQTAFSQADEIFVAMVANRHQEFLERCSRFIPPKAAVLITPGQMSSVTFAQEFRRQDLPIPLIGEVESNLHVAYLSDELTISHVLKPASRFCAAFPAADTPKLIQIFGRYYCLKPAADVLECALNLPNIDVHPAGSLLNMGRIYRHGSHFYRDCIDPPIENCVVVQYNEKKQLMSRMGYTVRTSVANIPQIRRPADEAGGNPFHQIEGPNDLTHRYYTEELFAGLPLVVSLGKVIGSPVSMAQALLTIGSAALGQDFYRLGRTLENLGIPAQSPEERRNFLAAGRL